MPLRKDTVEVSVAALPGQRLQVTALGLEVLRTGEAIVDELRGHRWKQIGADQFEDMRSTSQN